MLSKLPRVFGPGALLVLAAAAGGCGRSTATLSGTVTYRGRPVTSGEVVFLAADGRAAAHAPIDPDGRYTVQGVPPGEARVAVDNAPPSWYATFSRLPATLANDPEVREARAQAARYVPTPPRYRDPNQSGLTHTVEKGSQTYDIALP
jgi:hypothetical protein